MMPGISRAEKERRAQVRAAQETAKVEQPVQTASGDVNLKSQPETEPRPEADSHLARLTFPTTAPVSYVRQVAADLQAFIDTGRKGSCRIIYHW
jgi:hypothetical protein